MINWEERNRAKIPESYKEWLRFSGKCRIAGNTATFWDRMNSILNMYQKDWL